MLSHRDKIYWFQTNNIAHSKLLVFQNETVLNLLIIVFTLNFKTIILVLLTCSVFNVNSDHGCV